MLEDAEGEVHLEPFEPVDSEPTFFDSADVAQAFDSLKSTVILMQKVPLLEPARETSDTCECELPFLSPLLITPLSIADIEALILLRAFESNYMRTHSAYRRRRFGIIGKTVRILGVSETYRVIFRSARAVTSNSTPRS